MILLKIVLSFMKIGVLAFGGAYASIPLVEKEIVEIRQWMTYDEFSDLLALDELTPGPIMINSATFVGMKVSGIPGAIAATLGCILPSCILAFILFAVYRKYKKLSFMESILQTLKCMAFALIASTFIRILTGSLLTGNGFNTFGAVLMVLAFLIMRKAKISPLYIMLGCGLLNLLVHVCFPL